MAVFTGLLSVIGNQSNLDDGAKDSLLLMAGISDPAQAIFAATQFLLKIKKLNSGQMINVQGSSGTSGTVSIISMTDASAAVSEAAAAAFESIMSAAAATAKSATKKKSRRRTKTSKGTKNRARKPR